MTSLELAAGNNAEWCDAFCRAHGVVGVFDEWLWTSPSRTPPLYPDAVTLAPGVAATEVLARVDAGGGCSVKDSFADLDLRVHGFDVLFEAQWLLLEHADADAAGWGRVEGEAELHEWEVAWGPSPTGSAFFVPALLATPQVAFLARRDDRRVVAGAIASRSEGVIGLSNVFGARDDIAESYAGAAALAQRLFGPLAVVGYESGAPLAAVRRAGFAAIGGLRVWAKG